MKQTKCIYVGNSSARFRLSMKQSYLCYMYADIDYNAAVDDASLTIGFSMETGKHTNASDIRSGPSVSPVTDVSIGFQAILEHMFRWSETNCFPMCSDMD